MDNKSPAFQWYPKDILSSARVAEMTLEEEGAYRRALDFCWLNGSIPADAERCARLIGKGASILVATVVQAMFIPNPNDTTKLIHERLEIERIKQEEWRNKSREGGKKSAEMRQAKRLQSLKGGSKMVATKPQPNGNSSSSSSSSSLKDNTNVLSKKKRACAFPENFTISAEMKLWAENNSPRINLELETANFQDHHTGKGSTAVDWIATWRTWMRNAEKWHKGESAAVKPKDNAPKIVYESRNAEMIAKGFPPMGVRPNA